MEAVSYEITNDKAILELESELCATPEEFIESGIFRSILEKCLDYLKSRDSNLLDIFQDKEVNAENIDALIQTLKYLTKVKADDVENIVPKASTFLQDKETLFDFTEYLYNYWRDFDRFMICNSETNALDERPYRTFNDTAEKLMHLVRRSYRDIQENITGKHPQVYRQVHAGVEVGTIVLPEEIKDVDSQRYSELHQIPKIRQILLYPPLIFNPPKNKRKGVFEKIEENPLDYVDVDTQDWLCFPIKIAHTNIQVYVHKKFYDIGFQMSNLFELANKEEVQEKPDAIYLYGVEEGSIDELAELPTVYTYDKKEDLLVGAIPRDDEFGYFGYLKKMMLTLHNTRVMKDGNMPFHGAFYELTLQNGQSGNFLLIGDSGAGKSESIEAFRRLAQDELKDMKIIADDMGSIAKENGEIKAYGTETGAFQRLDDFPPGYAFGQLDRAIISRPGKNNSRITLPVTTYEDVMKGTKIDYVLYANNYEEIDEDHPIVEEFDSPDEALSVFREGKVMSKGTTDDVGIRNSYFANIFGPPQMKDQHDEIAQDIFESLFENDIYVGQIRTRLGIQGMELEGPQAAAKEMLNMIQNEVG